ncbi:MAG: hypothetical protein WBC27_08000, partial [Candidatus Nanopelagicales bacterium]
LNDGKQILGPVRLRAQRWPLPNGSGLLDPAGQGAGAVRPIRDAIRTRVQALIADIAPEAQ